MNSCNFTGRLVRDTELRTMTNEKKTIFAIYTIAVQDDFDKDKANFISCQSYGKTAEYLEKHGKKGALIEFSGKANTYTKDGKTNTLFNSESVRIVFGSKEKEAETTTATKPNEEQDDKKPQQVDEDLPF